MVTRLCPRCLRPSPPDADRCAACGAGLGSTAGAASTESFDAGEVVPAQPAEQLIGRTFRRYRVDAQLGAGGMGVVYRGTDLELQRRVALKFLSPARASDPDALQRFTREARAASALDHPNIGTVYDLEEVEGIRFIVMALYDGETLKQRIARGALIPDEAQRIATQLAAALDAAHRAGITHRDVKPANVLVTRDGQVKLLDFGVAKLSTLEAGEASLTRAGGVVGTIAYMAPEQLRGEEIDARADLWSLGVVLSEMLRGRAPFVATTTPLLCARILGEAPEPLPAGVPSHLVRLVDQLLQKAPEARPKSAAEVLAALEAAPFTHVGPRRRTWGVAAAVLALVLVGGGGLIAAQRSHTPVALPDPIAPQPPQQPTPEPEPKKTQPQPQPEPTPPPTPAQVPSTGRLSASANRADASWTLDGKMVGAGVERVSLDAVPGRHHLHVTAPGHLPRDATFEVEAGRTLELTLTLERAPRSSSTVRPPPRGRPELQVPWPPPE